MTTFVSLFDASVLLALGKVAAKPEATLPDLSQPVTLMAVLAVLSFLPFAIIMVTSFSKVAVVLSLMRSALGTQQTPPTMVLTALAAVLTGHIMAPVAEKMYEQGNTAFEQKQKDFEVLDAVVTVAEPLRQFILKHASAAERARFVDLSKELRGPETAETVKDEDLVVILPAFVLTELKEAFTMGFLIFLPFVVLDMLIANVLLALGMQTLSPSQVSLPFKLLLFVAVDGLGLIANGLILGYR